MTDETTKKLEKIEKLDTQWQKQLSSMEYSVTRKAGTEKPFTGPHLQEKRNGKYHCVCCNAPLFESETKFDSGTGWPSFFDVTKNSTIAEKSDRTYGIVRTEITCEKCAAHIGHLFNDGPKPTGKRYCTNGNALKFEPTNKAE